MLHEEADSQARNIGYRETPATTASGEFSWQTNLTG